MQYLTHRDLVEVSGCPWAEQMNKTAPHSSDLAGGNAGQLSVTWMNSHAGTRGYGKGTCPTGVDLPF